MRLSVLSLVLLFAPCLLAAAPPARSIGDDRVEATIASLTAKFGEAQAPRIRLGVRQVAERWWPSDGDAEAFAAFCADNFVADEGALAGEFARLERVLEHVSGHLHVVRRELLTPQDLDTGPVGRVDSLMAAFDLGSHLSDDLFAAKVAHFALLNFPVHSLADRLAAGSTWDRAAWARSRLMDSFAERVPAEVAQEATRALHRRRPLHRRVQHPDGPPDRARREPAVPRGAAPGHPLGAARRAGLALRREGRAGQAADDPEGDGADRPPGDPAGRDRQPDGGLGPGVQLRRAGAGGEVARRPGAGAGHALRGVARQLPRAAPGRSLLSGGAVGDRAVVRVGTADPGEGGRGAAHDRPRGAGGPAGSAP